MLLTGAPIDAREAERAGLVNRVVPADRLAEETRQLVSDLVATADEDLEFLNRLRSKYGLPSGDPAGR